jgi:hypothetical protein
MNGMTNDIWQWGTIAASIAAAVSVISALISTIELKRERHMAMNLKQVYALRDLAIKNSIARAFSEDLRPEVFEMIDRAFAEGEATWQDSYLNTIFSPEERKRLGSLADSVPTAL